MDAIAIEESIVVDARLEVRESIAVTLANRVLRWVRPSKKPGWYRVQITKGAKHDPTRPMRNVGDSLSVRLNSLPEISSNTHGRYSFAVTPMTGNKAIGTPGILLNRMI